jgi:hypothetical protein
MALYESMVGPSESLIGPFKSLVNSSAGQGADVFHSPLISDKACGICQGRREALCYVIMTSWHRVVRIPVTFFVSLYRGLGL